MKIMLLLFKELISDIYVYTTTNLNFFSKSLTAGKTDTLEKVISSARTSHKDVLKVLHFLYVLVFLWRDINTLYDEQI